MIELTWKTPFETWHCLPGSAGDMWAIRHNRRRTEGKGGRGDMKRLTCRKGGGALNALWLMSGSCQTCTDRHACSTPERPRGAGASSKPPHSHPQIQHTCLWHGPVQDIKAQLRPENVNADRKRGREIWRGRGGGGHAKRGCSSSGDHRSISQRGTQGG